MARANLRRSLDTRCLAGRLPSGRMPYFSWRSAAAGRSSRSLPTKCGVARVHSVDSAQPLSCTRLASTLPAHFAFFSDFCCCSALFGWLAFTLFALCRRLAGALPLPGELVSTFSQLPALHPLPAPHSASSGLQHRLDISPLGSPRSLDAHPRLPPGTGFRL